MSEFEKKLLARIEKLERENLKLILRQAQQPFIVEENTTPTYQYSKIRDIDLRKLFNIKKSKKRCF